MIDTQQVLEGIQGLLTGSAPLVAVVPANSIGPHLQDNETFPHILWNIEASNLGIKGEVSYEMQLVLDVWTNVRGIHGCWEINDLIAAALDGQEITIASGSAPVLKFETIDVDTESDGRTRHATIVYNLIVTE